MPSCSQVFDNMPLILAPVSSSLPCSECLLLLLVDRIVTPTLSWFLSAHNHMQGCKVRKKDDLQMITMTKELQLQAKNQNHSCKLPDKKHSSREEPQLQNPWRKTIAAGRNHICREKSQLQIPWQKLQLQGRRTTAANTIPWQMP